MRKDEAVEHFGTQEEVAKVLGITRQAVVAWPELVPLGRAYQLQVLTGGKLQVRSELYPPRHVQPAA